MLFDRTFSTRAAKELARRFGGDPSSADWRHFGRLAGFTNQKPKRRLSERFPTVRATASVRGRTYAQRAKFLRGSEIRSQRRPAPNARRERHHVRLRPKIQYDPSLSFTADPRYGGDLHRADMAWALHAASRGLSEQQIRDEILHGRDLSKKGRCIAASLCGTNSDQGGQQGRAAPLSAATLWTAPADRPLLNDPP